MNGKTETKAGLALLLAAGMAWAGGVMGREENRGLSPITPNLPLDGITVAFANLPNPDMRRLPGYALAD